MFINFIKTFPEIDYMTHVHITEIKSVVSSIYSAMQFTMHRCSF